MEDKKKVLLSVNDLKVQFRVRGRILTAIRGISLDIYENECIAIVGESGSGKSVFTKTFAGMLDSNGFVSNGQIIFEDDELSEFHAPLDDKARANIAGIQAKLDEASPLEFGAETWKKILELESEHRIRSELGLEAAAELEKKTKAATARRTELFNLCQTLDPKKEKAELKQAKADLAAAEKELKNIEQEKKVAAKAAKAAAASDTAYNAEYEKKLSELKAQHAKEVSAPITEEQKARNLIIAKEVHLSVCRYHSARERSWAMT